MTEDWEEYVLDWLDDIATRLGKTPEWLRDEILDITALLGEEVPGNRSAERVRLLLAIPDDGILRLVLARLKSESKLTTTDLRFALDMLGCGPDVGRHTWLKSRGLQEMRGILGHVTLSQLARDYGEALAKVERNKLLPRAERTRTVTECPARFHRLPLPPSSTLICRQCLSAGERGRPQSGVWHRLTQLWRDSAKANSETNASQHAADSSGGSAAARGPVCPRPWCDHTLDPGLGNLRSARR